MAEIELYLQLFGVFFIIGLFTFGGGYAMLSLIQTQIVAIHGWLTESAFTDIVAISQMTPGPVGINCATYVGYKMAGMTGAVLATLGIVLPSFVILYFISMFLEHFLEYQVIAAACRGIKVGVSLLILDAGSTMLKKMKKKPQPRIIAGCAFVIMLLGNLFSLRISSVALMLAAGIISLSVFAAKSAPAQRGGAGQ